MLPTKVYEWWTKLYVYILRPMLKWVLRYVTGKCELLRITYEETDQASRTKKIENSLSSSRSSELKSYSSSTDFSVDDAAKKIAELKAVVPEVHAQFHLSLIDSLYRIRSYNKILHDAEQLRKIKYSSDDETHEAKLRQLWALYKPEVPLPSRIGNHWQDMGFQGTDPKTDFRGMGMLGLQQMIFFASTYPDEARHTFTQSHHPQYGYSFAIVAINITGLGYDLLAKRKLRSHFYALDRRDPDLQDFHKLYCHLLYDFSQYWIDQKPKDIMEFSRVRDKYIKTVKRKLKSEDPLLLSPFQQK